MRNGLWISVAVALALLAYCAWPLVGAARLAEAARRGDAAAVMQHVDVAALRRSLARQIVRAYMKQSSRLQKLGTLERGVAAGLGTSVADSLLETLLTPENITALLDKGRLPENLPGVTEISAQLPKFDELFRRFPVGVVLDSYFDGPTSFVVVAASGRGGYGVHLRLQGTTWRLSGLDLPSELTDRLAHQAAAPDKGAAAPPPP